MDNEVNRGWRNGDLMIKTFLIILSICVLFACSEKYGIPDRITIKPADIELDALRKVDQRINLFGYDDYNGDNLKELVLLYSFDDGNCVFALYGFRNNDFHLLSKTNVTSGRNAYEMSEKPLNSIDVDGIPGKEIVIEDGAASYQAIFFVVVRNDKLIITEERDFSDLVDCRSYDHKYYLVETVPFFAGNDLADHLKDNTFGVSRISYVNPKGELADLDDVPEALLPILCSHYFEKYLAQADIWNFIDLYSLARKTPVKINDDWIRLYTSVFRKHFDDPADFEKIVEVLLMHNKMDPASFRKYMEDNKIVLNI